LVVTEQQIEEAIEIFTESLRSVLA
jgi:hypothetical protein